MSTALALACVAIGANLDAPIERVLEAMSCLDSGSIGRVVARSSLYRTTPVGCVNQPDFINAVVLIRTPLSPLDLLRALLALEARLGRIRRERNGPRRIDLDLIAYDDRRIDLPELCLPHPRACARAFVMVPWAEVAPEAKVRGESVAEIAARLPQVGITKIEA